MELTELARISRQLVGSAQTINLGADIFLADATGRYLGRVCRYRECRPTTRRGRYGSSIMALEQNFLRAFPKNELPQGA